MRAVKNYQQKKNIQKVIFAADLIAYAFVEVSLSDATFMGGEYLNESHNMIY